MLFGSMMEQEYYLMPLNILGFGSSSSVFSAIDVLNFPSSVSALTALEKIKPSYGFFLIVAYLLKIVLFIYLIKLIILYFKNKFDDNDFIIGAIIIITNFTVSIGGYCLLFYVPLIPIIFYFDEYKKLRLSVLLLFIGLLGFIPIYSFDSSVQLSFFRDSEIKVNQYLALGSFLNPLINLVLLIKFYEKTNEKYNSKSLFS
jgi:hypothetical protein